MTDNTNKISLQNAPEVSGALLATKATVILPDGRSAECYVVMCPVKAMRECTPGTKVLPDGTEKTTKLDGAIAGSNGFTNFTEFAVSATFIRNNKSTNGLAVFA